MDFFVKNLTGKGGSTNGHKSFCFVATVWYFYTGAVSAEMFRQMQNSEIIRKMTEEFDEVMISYIVL